VADPQFGLKFGAQYEPRHAGVVGNVAMASRTVGEAFETIGRYLPTMVDATVHGVEVSDGIVFVYSYYIDPLMMSYRQKGDWAIAFACNLMRAGLGDPRWTPQEVLLPQLADETPAERRTRAEIMGDNIRVGHPWAGIRFDAGLLKRPMATADAMIEALMRHYGDLRLAALPEQRGEIEQLRREIARVMVKGEGGIEHLAKGDRHLGADAPAAAEGCRRELLRPAERRAQDAGTEPLGKRDSGAGGNRLFARLLRSQRVQSCLPALGRPTAGRLSSTTRDSSQIHRSEEVGAAG
jgi:hypothetical protein